jgi:glutaredoxin
VNVTRDGGVPHVRRVTLYGRPGCHLCDEAREVLERMGVPFESVNIETDDELHRRYLERIPVVVVDGEELFEYFVDEDVLRARLH